MPCLQFHLLVWIVLSSRLSKAKVARQWKPTWRISGRLRARNPLKDQFDTNKLGINVCTIPGCHTCADDSSRCEECFEGFELKAGECVSTRWRWWRALLIVVVLLALFVLAYILCLAWRPVVNQDALDWALMCRSLAKARDTTNAHKLFPLCKNLCVEPTVAGGLGILLHFRWQGALLIWAAFMTFVMGSVNLWNQHLNPWDVLKASPLHDEALEVCTGISKWDVGQHEAMRIQILWATGFLYVASSLGAIWFAFYQRKSWAKYEETTTTMTDVALLCSGFPSEAEGLGGHEGKRLEEEYLAFLSSTWGSSVLGVSISWDILEKADDVFTMVSKVNEDLENVDSLRPPGQQSSLPSIAKSDCPAEQSQAGLCFDPYMRCIDSMLINTEEARDKADNLVQRQSALVMLSQLKTTGHAYAVFKTERDRDIALNTPLPKFRGQYEIKTQCTQGNAETVKWEGFSVKSSDRIKRIVYGILVLIGVIVIWTIFFWGPFTLYVLSWTSTAGLSQGQATTGLLLSFLIMAGNQLVYFACDKISRKALFTSNDDQDEFAVALYSLAILVNTVLDLWLVTYMAFGWRNDVKVDPDALVRHPSVQHAMFVQLIFYLWPMALLVPFLGEPFVIGIGPYFLGKWFVRSNASLTRSAAESWLAPPVFDLYRYGDILVNVILVTCCFFLTAVNLWWIFFWLLISNVFIYFWDDYRFKRVTMRSHFAKQSVDILAQYMTAVPCAILAGAFVFKYMGGQSMVGQWGEEEFFHGHPTTWRSVFMAILTHLVIHVLVLAVVIPKYLPERSRDSRTSTTSTADEPRCISQNNRSLDYRVLAARVPCNWFNANPVHCLRSLFVYQHDPPHVYYVPGNQRLHKKNKDPQALIIYEASEFESEPESIFAEAKTFLSPR